MADLIPPAQGSLLRIVLPWCRVAYVVNDDRTFGFAYGTLEDHAEQGEERFSIEWSSDDVVSYDILAFSRPRQWQAKFARPVSRLLQRKFARDSKAAMTRAIYELATKQATAPN